MRKIKFRAWIGHKKEMYSWYQLKAQGDYLAQLLTGVYQGSVIMQYTGLKDKNGVEIYENDILNYSNIDNHHSEFSHNYVVEFCSQDFGEHSYQQTRGWNATPMHRFINEKLTERGNGIHSLFGTHKIEVIGNIHENKDLLK